MNKPKTNFYRRLVAMYGDYQANIFYTDKVGEEPPIIKEEKEEGFMDLNNM